MAVWISTLFSPATEMEDYLNVTFEKEREFYRWTQPHIELW